MIGHLINTDIGSRGVLELYLDYRRQNFNFLHNSAEMLLNNCENVLVITGFPIPPMQQAETDGPPGALAVYRAVERLGGKAEILTYPEVKNALEPFGPRFASTPEISDYSLVIAIETPGRASDGKYYSMSGLEITRETFDWAVIKARELGIPTIGIGDGGNEAGMGKIRELVKKHIPHGEKIGSVVETDELIVSAVSNWGAYGLIAQVSIESGKNLFGNWEERRVTEAAVGAGLIDGVSKKIEVSVDGISIGLHEKMVELLKGIIQEKLR